MWYSKVVALLVVGALVVPLGVKAEETPLRLPVCQNRSDEFYPIEAQMRALQGRVVLDLVINRHGRVTSAEVKNADADAALVEAAKKYWASATCKVSKDWADRGGETMHFSLNVVYLLNDAPEPAPLDPSSQQVVIRAKLRM